MVLRRVDNFVKNRPLTFLYSIIVTGGIISTSYDCVKKGNEQESNTIESPSPAYQNYMAERALGCSGIDNLDSITIDELNRFFKKAGLDYNLESERTYRFVGGQLVPNEHKNLPVIPLNKFNLDSLASCNLEK